MADLGDLTNFIKEGGVSNLDWLDVDETEYRKQDRLPEQNLQISPDLEALWRHEDKPATAYLEPNQAAVPRTMGDLSQVHGPLRAKPAEIVRAVKLAMLQTTDAARIEDAITKRFDRDSIVAASQEILAAMEERGLLGRFYVAAEDFTGCSSGKGLEIITKCAKGAPYVLAKAACRDCSHAHKTADGKAFCSQFHKQLVITLPYTEEMADKVAAKLKSAGRDIKDQPGLTARDRIREAFLAPSIKLAPPAAMPKPVENVTRLLSQASTPEPVAIPVDLTASKQAARDAVDSALRGGRLKVTEAQEMFKAVACATTLEHLQVISKNANLGLAEERVVYQGAGIQAPPAVATPEAAQAGVEKAAQDAAKAQEKADKLAAERRAAPVIALLRREMLKGRGPKELVTALRLAFDVRDLAESKPLWEPVFREAGLFGVVYASQASFGDCREGADFLAQHNPGIRVLVAGAKCTGCIYNKIGRCLLYGKPLVQSTSEILTPETVAAVIQEHKTAGRLAPTYTLETQAPAVALRTIHAAVEQRRTASVQASERLSVQTAFHGQPVGQVTSGITRREIVRTASRYINEGLYGDQLREAMLGRFDPRDLVAAKEDLKPVLAEQGLQGIFYVDPTIYADYGHGCEEAMRLHRSRLVANVKPGPKCSSCILQTKPGYCSKLNKTLGEPVYADKAAQQRAILTSGPATEIRYEGLVNNGHAMLQEFELSQREAEVVIDEPQKPVDVTIEFGNQGIKL